MKFCGLLLGLLTSSLLVRAQYFSAGWTPGQPVAPNPTGTPAATASYVPGSPDQQGSGTKQSGGFSGFLSKLGFDIAKTLEQPKLWDKRIPLITDENYNDMIVNEPLTEQEEKDRIWALIITVTASRQEGISKIMDQIFDAAYNETVIAGDLPNVRWGRIDYINVTYLTTKWNVWSAPFLVILRNRGQELRFYKGHHLRLKETALREFLQTEDWKYTPIWSSPYAPGGEREYILHFIATWMTTIYNLVASIPRWLFYILSGGLASLILNILHRKQPAPRQQQQQQQNRPGPPAPTPSAQPAQPTPPVPEAGTSSATSPSSSSNQSKAKKRKK
ncbi:hypothetical protein AMATHDRAFT_61595 [Amanita thiersii Skay4041]|uniref:Thioredoxin-like fold domain-containing protein n=1 Tax=Amanita thiersii Skay4041 TaxID=703135 RepID=A0A2A9NJ79_9AGAR|nr:hypothetical protein AMATHDRAFT_61595 [Amanita thiersii Skay4041]